MSRFVKTTPFFCLSSRGRDIQIEEAPCSVMESAENAKDAPDFRDILIQLTSRTPDKAFTILIRWLDDICPDDILNGKARAWTPDVIMGRIDDLFLARNQTRTVLQIEEKNRTPSSSISWMYTHPGQPLSGDDPSEAIRSDIGVKSFVEDHAVHLVRIALQSEYPQLQSHVLARNFVHSVVRLLIVLSHSGGWEKRSDGAQRQPFEALWVDLLCPDWTLHRPFAKPTYAAGHERDYAIRRQHDTISDNDLFIWRRSLKNGELVDVFQMYDSHPCTGRVEWEAGNGMQYLRERVGESCPDLNMSVRTSTNILPTPYYALRPSGSLVGAGPLQSLFSAQSADWSIPEEKEYKLNELVDVRYRADEKSGPSEGGDWKRARICEFRASSSSRTKQCVRVHAILTAARTDIWLSTDSDDLVRLGMWRATLKPGDRVDHLDGSNRWYRATVIEPYQLANETDNRPSPHPRKQPSEEREILSREERFAVRLVTHVWLTYPGYHSSYDVIEARDSSRLARPGTFASLYDTPLESDQLEEMMQGDKRFVRNSPRRIFPETHADPPPWDILRRPMRYRACAGVDSDEGVESKQNSPKKWLVDVYNAFRYRPKKVEHAPNPVKRVVDEVAIHIDQGMDNAWKDEASRRFEASRQPSFTSFLQYALERGALLAMARVISRSGSPFPLLLGWIQMIPLLSEQFYQQAIDPLIQFVAMTFEALNSGTQTPVTDEQIRTVGYELCALVKSVDRLQDGEFSLVEATAHQRSKGWAGREHAYFQLFALSIDSFKHRFAFPTVLEGIIFEYWYVPWWVEGSWICGTCTLENVRGTITCALCLGRRAKELPCEEHLQPLQQIFAHMHKASAEQRYPTRHPLSGLEEPPPLTSMGPPSHPNAYRVGGPRSVLQEPRFVGRPGGLAKPPFGRKLSSSSEDDTPPAYR
jgi:hypothetical protein